MRYTPLAAAVLVTVAGCSRGDETSDTTVAAATSAVAAAPSAAPLTTPAAPTTPATTLPATPPPTVAATPAPTTAAPVDPAALLTAALDQLAPGYHFVTTATVGGQVAVSAEGDHANGSTRMTLTSSGTATDYVITAESAWAFADGTWQELDRAESPLDPLAALRAPTSVTLLAGDATATTVQATYPASALGLAGDAASTVEFQLANGSIASLAYVAAPANVSAVITPIDPATVITLPNA